jgi:glycosyltransferase involved in cell wall biosynthesis
MKVLFCSLSRLDCTLGAPKVIIELAEGLRNLGVECDLIGPSDVAEGLIDGRHDPVRYAMALRTYLHKHAADYDVVDYDHEYLPYDRSEFPANTLMVARSVLLHYHFSDIRFPQPRNLRAVTVRLVRHLLSAKARAEQRRRTNRTGLQADHFFTLNTQDRQTLIRYGYDPAKVTVVGVGLHPQRFVDLAPTSENAPATPRVAFVGTFDYRKGCLDMPRIADVIVRAVPQAKIRLIGTSGLFATAEQVLAHFPGKLRSHVEVIPRFAPDELPALLNECSAGFFPSYIEGFGFGVLEMLAAALPVVAYDAPGPPDMLPPEYLVPRGDVAAMGGKLAELLENPSKLQAARIAARRRAGDFTWAAAAEKTLETYRSALNARRRSVSSSANPKSSPATAMVDAGNSTQGARGRLNLAGQGEPDSCRI